MNTLIINGSPRADGNTAFLIKKLTERLKGNFEIINAYDIDFNPCIDCRSCIKSDCIFNDKITELINRIDDFDSIVTATPLHYNQPAGMLMALMSRSQIIYNKNIKLNKKRGGIIVTGGGNTVVNSADCEKTLRIMLRSFNAEVAAYARSLHTDTLPACKDKNALNEICEMANILNT